jgi:hypothetical protein
MDVIAVPDYTCNFLDVLSYYESKYDGEYTCFCSGSNYNGLPSFTFSYYDKKVEFTMDAQ